MADSQANYLMPGASSQTFARTAFAQDPGSSGRSLDVRCESSRPLRLLASVAPPLGIMLAVSLAISLVAWWQVRTSPADMPEQSAAV